MNERGAAANGTYDLRFILYNAFVGGCQQGSILTNSDVVVTDGLFTVPLDFGASFPGQDRWPEIGVRHLTQIVTRLNQRLRATAK